jgi:uncharacterized protein YjbJ (UPF0337 family)
MILEGPSSPSTLYSSRAIATGPRRAADRWATPALLSLRRARCCVDRVVWPAARRAASPHGRAHDLLLVEVFVTHPETAMNNDQTTGAWHQIKGKVKEQWGKLTDDDLTQLEGKSEQLAGKLQERYGMARDEADRQATDFRNRNNWH